MGEAPSGTGVLSFNLNSLHGFLLPYWSIQQVKKIKLVWGYNSQWRLGSQAVMSFLSVTLVPPGELPGTNREKPLTLCHMLYCLFRTGRNLCLTLNKHVDPQPSHLCRGKQYEGSLQAALSKPGPWTIGHLTWLPEAGNDWYARVFVAFLGYHPDTT